MNFELNFKLTNKPIIFLIISDFLNFTQFTNAFIPSHLSKNISQFSGVSSKQKNIKKQTHLYG